MITLQPLPQHLKYLQHIIPINLCTCKLVLWIIVVVILLGKFLWVKVVAVVAVVVVVAAVFINSTFRYQTNKLI